MVGTKKGKDWFKDIFDEYYEYVRNYLFYLSGDIEIAEDIVQDVFLKVWEVRETVKDETVKSLLFRIARNLFYNTHKRKVLDLRFASSYEHHNENESPEYLLEMKEFDSKLQKAISDLPEHCRTIFLMSRIDEMKYHEIAQSLKISVKAVEKQVSKALKLLREHIDYKV
ncbi:MAG: RNA polymerase sigma-70 factor [Prolixibacteraceae bacterium]|nr:RNA polymerase sigma-70 factor [Prolixibacteraceae bacterium]MBN2648707.1 RNA polymerase sigma-70 factor [Prolixibacteraceae bacterium]